MRCTCRFLSRREGDSFGWKENGERSGKSTLVRRVVISVVFLNGVWV